MSYQNFQTGQPMYQGMGYGYADPQRPKMRMTNPAMTNKEDRDLLAKNNNAFSLKIDPVEMAAAHCTHKNPATGEFLTIPNGDGTVTCSHCHKTFNPDALDSATVRKIVDDMQNVLETCKMLGVDLSNELICQVFQIAPVLAKIPQIFDIAANSFNQYTSQFNNVYVPQNGGINYTGLYNAMRAGSPVMPYGAGYQDPNMYQPYGYQQPMTPFMNQQMMTMPGAGLYADQVPYQQPAMQQPPMNTPIMPQATAPQQAPTQPTAPPTATIEQQVKL